MKTIGFPLHEEITEIDEASALQRICQRHTSKATIRVRDIEINPREQVEMATLSQYGGKFIRIVTDGPDEAQLATAIHQQLVKDQYCDY